MKPRKVVVSLELTTDLRVQQLKDMILDVISNSDCLGAVTVEQIQANVIKNAKEV